MTIKGIKYYIVSVIMFFSFINTTQASVVINEVEVNPTDGRFIELYNNSNDSVDLTGWYIQRKTANGTFGSLITKTYFEGKNIESNGYFIISKNSILNPDISVESLTLTDSNTIQLKDMSGNIVDKVGWGETNDCQNPCPPNPTIGQSISRLLGSGFVVSTPTPRETNSIVNNIDSISNSIESVNHSNETTVFTSPKAIEVNKIITKIISPKVVTAGVPFIIDHQTAGLKKEKIILGKFVWNFGDGMKKEGNTSDPFDYIYNYPGEYVLTLSYFESALSNKPDAVDRLIIKVIPSGVVISSVGNYTDPFVELENNSNYEMSISKWIIKGSVHSFLIPEGMIILSNKKLKLSPKITGFDFNDLSYISIVDSSGVVFATYPNIKSFSTKYEKSKIIQDIAVKSEIVKNDQIENTEEVINLNNLGASVGDTDLPNNIISSTYTWIGLVGVIIIGIISVIFIRKKNEYPDYVEKEISAKDMTIIE